MKVTFEKTDQYRKFAELQPGEIFLWHGSLYIKIKNNTGSDLADFTSSPNTVGIFRREFWSVCDTAVVELVTCELPDSEERMLIC